MRAFHVFPLALAAACATGRPDAATRPSPEETYVREGGRVPSTALAHVVEIFVGTTCAGLDAGAKVPHRTGFYANPRTVATDALLYDQGGGAIFPDFAVLDADGCRDAQYADLYREFGTLFLRVHGPRHPGALPLEDGDSAHRMAALRYDGRDAGGRPRFKEGVHFLPTRSGSMAGSPVFDRRGRCVAMVSNGITDDAFGERPRPMTVPAVTIAKLLANCGPCEDD